MGEKVGTNSDIQRRMVTIDMQHEAHTGYDNLPLFQTNTSAMELIRRKNHLSDVLTVLCEQQDSGHSNESSSDYNEDVGESSSPSPSPYVYHTKHQEQEQQHRPQQHHTTHKSEIYRQTSSHRPNQESFVTLRRGNGGIVKEEKEKYKKERKKENSPTFTHHTL